MAKLWDINSPLMRVLSFGADLLILNCMWLLFCIPVVTIGAATAAIYRVTLDMAKDAGPSVIVQFWRAFTASWKRATGVFLIMLLVLAVCLADLWFVFLAFPNTSLVIKGIGILPILLWCMTSAHLYPLLAYYPLKPLQALRNSLIISIGKLPITALMLVIDLLPLILYIAVPDFFIKISIFWLLLGVALSAYLNALLLQRFVFPSLPSNHDQPPDVKE